MFILYLVPIEAQSFTCPYVYTDSLLGIAELRQHSKLSLRNFLSIVRDVNLFVCVSFIEDLFKESQ